MNFELMIPEKFIGRRIDVALAELSGFSRSKIQKLFKEGKCSVDYEISKDSSKKILKECIVKILDTDLDEEYEIIPENIPLDILFEDEFIVVLNKRAGMVCHPAPGHRSATLVNALAYHFNNSLSDIGGSMRPGIVHRLDKDTSGVMLIAKNNEAHLAFSNLFSNEKGHLIKRKYTCFVFGTPHEKKAAIETFIARHPKNRQIYTVHNSIGKRAITLYAVKNSVYFSSTKSISEIECELLTGRTHQIRVHMKYIGHHIIGDQIYGRSKIEQTYPDIVRKFSRQALHSQNLEFLHPFSKEWLSFSAELPSDMTQLKGLF